MKRKIVFSEINRAYARKISKLAGCGQAYSELCIEWAHQKYAENEPETVMELLEEAQNAHHRFSPVSKFDYLADVYDIPRKIAVSCSFEPVINGPADDRIKIIYILRNVQGAAVVKAVLQIIECHDKDKFDIRIALSRNSDSVNNSEFYDFRKQNILPIFGLEESPSPCTRLEFCRNIAKRIRDFSPDIVITTVVGPFEALICYAIAPVQTIHLILGDYWGFVLPGTNNRKIVFVKDLKEKYPVTTYIKPLIPSNPSIIKAIKPIEKNDEEKINIIVSGRPPKFSSTQYWTTICELLSCRNDIKLTVIGTTIDSILPWVKNIDFSNQDISFIPRLPRDEFTRLIQQADLVLDTFPEGGGQAIAEALQMNKIVVTFQTPSNAERFFEVNPATDWIPEQLTVQRDDSQQLINLIGRLIDDKEFKAKAEELIKKSAVQLFESATENIQIYEQFLLNPETKL